MQRTILAASALCTSLLIACGGGNNDSATLTPPVIRDDLVITGANSKSAAAHAYAATAQTGEMGDFVGVGGIAVGPSDNLAKPSLAPASGSVVQQVLRKVPFGPDIQPCGVDGTVTLSGNIVNPLTLTAGDEIVAVSADCDDGLGEIINGTMRLAIETFSGDLFTGLYLLVVDVELIDFEVQGAMNTVTSNGFATVTIDTSGLPLVSLSIAGDELTNEWPSRSESIYNFITSQTVDTSIVPEPYTIDASGTLDSSELGGAIQYSSPLMFQGLGAAYPYTGELLVKGANGASVRLVTLDESTVRIDTDTNGDGVVDLNETTTWVDLAASLL